MNTAAVAKIKLINNSLRCFTYGLLGWLPLIGLPFALAALWLAGRARVKEKQLWNAARPYRIWGAILAAAGILFWFLVVVLIACNSINHGGSGGTYGLAGDC